MDEREFFLLGLGLLGLLGMIMIFCFSRNVVEYFTFYLYFQPHLVP